MGIFDKLKKNQEKKRFGAWQIEITTRCGLQCTMCIKTACMEWHRKDMSVSNFEKIVPYLHHVKSVVLEGWGESLLHKSLIDFIHLAKSAGPEVGFVTSGMGLTPDHAHQIVDAGIDFMGFSLSGATAKTHNAIRVNSDFDALITSLKYIKDLDLSVVDNPSGKPKLHIVYLMLKDNVNEIPMLLDLAHEVGISEIVLLNIIQVTSREQDSNKTFTCEEGSLYKNVMAESVSKAKKLRINFSMPSVIPQDVAVCSENPLDNLYISVDGDVSPCVYLNPPVSSPFIRIFCGTERPTHPVRLGNIFTEPLERIWASKEYEDFRGSFISRQKRWEESYTSLLEMRHPDDSPVPSPPLPCRTCHKMLGF
jgi:MoaA/NifB/PqqE/SkfB family radical SAM enzyme